MRTPFQREKADSQLSVFLVRGLSVADRYRTVRMYSEAYTRHDLLKYCSLFVKFDVKHSTDATLSQGDTPTLSVRFTSCAESREVVGECGLDLVWSEIEISRRLWGILERTERGYRRSASASAMDEDDIITGKAILSAVSRRSDYFGGVKVMCVSLCVWVLLADRKT